MWAAYGELCPTSAKSPCNCPVGSLFRKYAAQYTRETMLDSFARWPASLSLLYTSASMKAQDSKGYLQRDTRGQQAAQLRFQLRSGTSMLRHHDSLLRDQPSYDMEDRLCAACCEPARTGSMESLQHVLLHCPEYEHHRAALRAKVACLPGAQGNPHILD